MPAEVILQHGWAFADSMWGDWLPQLSALGVRSLVAERGYFAAPPLTPEFSSNASYKVVVAHSLGLHMLSASVVQQADLIVLCGSFLHFHPQQPEQNKRSKRVINAMIGKMQSAPDMVLADFAHNCYQPEAKSMPVIPPATGADSELLLRDLHLLNEHRLDAGLMSGKKLLILQGTQDIIVPLAASAALQDALPGSQRFVFAQTGHALPLTRHQECIALLASEITTQLESKVAYVGSSNR